ncbi:hypothetical protein A2291_06025 [candidate division WOR-1 bacterium RIFOXYB2_FULL_42_35]|uniref:Outer membrane protein beta-barrel domain-containing protein n=1 Tax=candidate division WOR-1 bacterium RIFOXYC2_FULL_41_25 TaxID=1802586 RepID=A0A1F4TJJ1_UNCSA|nr:MAG: hypothetical protein A2247_01685 [candidate division WOR-1 bacterium RIFOXYA2_FULL_41_14]OGC22282.1 MAG: hypothetical protein A2291_06025 [candidate division WOR-1 bacterium RIFOXYB2_FULL_42_35]OGC32901.1 MAG: hypothetical protein A2462_00700 [candidate division WOR-1 bacterium RIFOXYC2_FULL_41_25]OGC41710.1 MAG: hypothetical protein A2548_04935 [candidate division WOR-1 bacterium RIFOXYD2_FULL_41_8]
MRRIVQRAMFYFVCILFFSFSLVVPSQAGQMGFGLDYGYINNLGMFASNSSEAGTILQVSYLFKKNNFYTLALEIGFIADNNVFKSATTPTYTETGCFLNINNIFHLPELLFIKPYVSVGTAINGVNSWRKEGGSFIHNANNVFADINFSGGIEFWFFDSLSNIELSCPALLHPYYISRKVPMVLSFGVKHYWDDK